MLLREVCVLDMGRRSNDAAKMDAQNKLRMEECARYMGQSATHAATMDAPSML